MNYNNNIQSILGIILAMMIFTVALELRFIAFKAVLLRPIAVLSGLLGQFILLPWITLAITLLLELPPGIELGMLLVASCPGGNLSNIITHMAKGNTALSVSMTTVSSTLAIITLPLNFALTSHLNPTTREMLSGTGELQLDTKKILINLIILLVLPLTIGMVIGNFKTLVAHKITPLLKKVSSISFIAFLILAIYNSKDIILNNFGFIFIIVVFHNFIALLIGYLMSVFFKQDEANKRAITIEVGMQNSGLALGLIFSSFQAESNMALIAAFWGIWHIISGLILIQYWKNKPTNKEIHQ
jgi:bile acid:Na+ symporter, BASS family